MVTLSVDSVLFREVVLVGELVTLGASINYMGSTSMEVGIRVVADDIHAAELHALHRKSEDRTEPEDGAGHGRRPQEVRDGYA